VVRSDSGLNFQSRQFRQACRDYRLTQQFIMPYTPEQNGVIERFSGASRRSVSGSTTSKALRRLGERFEGGSVGTTRNVPTRL
jgi:transposase InsO family protein